MNVKSPGGRIPARERRLVRRCLSAAAARRRESLPEVLAAMRKLAASRTPNALELEAYALCEQFRPAIPAGEAAWGKAGTLSLETIDALAHRRPSN
jgi:hypothetical protein